jgi:hypothetical protein
VTPHSGLDNAWGAELALIATTVVLTALLVLVLVRGAVTFWRAFFGTWLAVLGASVIGAVVRGLIDTDTFRGLNTDGAGRFTIAVFGPLGPSTFVVVAAFLLGLVTALVAAAVAVSTRRPAFPGASAPPPAPAYAPVPEPPPPYYGEAAPTPPPWQEQRPWPEQAPWRDQPPTPQPPPWQEQPSSQERRFEPYGGQPDAGHPTTVLRPGGDDAPTTQYAPPPGGSPGGAPTGAGSPGGAPTGAGSPGGAPPTAPAGPAAGTSSPAQAQPPEPRSTGQPPAGPSSGEPTIQFPRPPDDEDLH